MVTSRGKDSWRYQRMLPCTQPLKKSGGGEMVLRPFVHDKTAPPLLRPLLVLLLLLLLLRVLVIVVVVDDPSAWSGANTSEHDSAQLPVVSYFNEVDVVYTISVSQLFSTPIYNFLLSPPLLSPLSCLHLTCLPHSCLPSLVCPFFSTLSCLPSLVYPSLIYPSLVSPSFVFPSLVYLALVYYFSHIRLISVL